MTADSGEIWCAWRSTSTPSTPGILISVTITSNKALSILRLASSPPVTVSTLCPSRRRAMSSSSQIERSSSQTRMLPTLATSCRQRRPAQLRPARFPAGSRLPSLFGGLRSRLRLLHAPQPEHKARALAHLRPCPHFPFMRLHDLVDDRQPQTRAAFKIRLERLKDFFRLLRLNAGPGIRKIHFPVRTAFTERH